MKVFLSFLFAGVMFCSCCNVDNEKKSKCMSTNENAVVEAIMSRRSIRAYKPDQIKPEELDVILKCAINAPSAMNRQPWEVRVIQDKALLDEMVAAFVESVKQSGDSAMVERVSTPGFNPIFNAPTFIIIAHDTNNHYGYSDCGMLAQNILLAAESMNIGTCTIGGFMNFLRSPAAKKYVDTMNLSEGYELHIGVAMGYKDQNPDAKPRDAQKVQFVK